MLAKIEDGRRDSGLLALNLELLNLYIQKDSYQNYLIKNQETVILNLKAVNAHTDRIIELYKGNISEYEERSQVVNILLIATGVLLIWSLIAFMFSRKLNNNEKEIS